MQSLETWQAVRKFKITNYQEILLIKIGIDSNQLTLSKVITDLGPFLGPEEDLTIVARGISAHC
jgi:hypothetical protein